MKYPDDFINKVICGDCLEVMKYIPDGAVDLVLTDIPYNISQSSNGLRNLDYGKWDHQYGQEENWIKNIARISSGSVAVFCHKTQFSYIVNYIQNFGYSSRTLVWHKPNPTVMNCDKIYIEATELCVYGKLPKATYNPKYKHNVFEKQSPTVRQHPTQKPIELFKEIICDTTNPNDLILDPFLGSGTTAVACKQLGRRFIGIEINPEYCKIAEDRLRQEELF